MSATEWRSFCAVCRRWRSNHWCKHHEAWECRRCHNSKRHATLFTIPSGLVLPKAKARELWSWLPGGAPVAGFVPPMPAALQSR